MWRELAVIFVGAQGCGSRAPVSPATTTPAVEHPSLTMSYLDVPASAFLQTLSQGLGSPWLLEGERKISFAAERIGLTTLVESVVGLLDEAGCSTETGADGGRVTRCPDPGPAWVGCFVWGADSAAGAPVLEGVSRRALNAGAALLCSTDREQQAMIRPPERGPGGRSRP